MLKELDVNGVRYAMRLHRINPSLPCLLMLHGFMGDSRGFNHLAEGLGKTCNPITLDLLGHGETEKSYDPDRYGENRQIEDILSIAKSIGMSPLFLYGYSMGGRLALKTAQFEPSLFKGLILESTTFGITNEEDRRKRQKTDKMRAKAIQEDFTGFLKEWEALPLFQSENRSRNQSSEQFSYKKIHSEQDPEALAASLKGFGTGFMTPLTKRDQKYNGPVLLLAGSDDQKYIDINKKLKQFFEHADIRILSAGHRVHVDNPANLTREINLFIEQNR